MTRSLAQLLSPRRLTEVVDIGANPIDGEPPYRPLLAAGLCRVTGFEPQAGALAKLEQRKGPNERYLPYAIGDGGAHTFHVCTGPGMASLLEPEPATLEVFERFKNYSRVTARIPVQTRRLDDVDEVEAIDFLKIDIQGSELAVFRNGRRKLERAVALQTEVSFIPLYRNQPVFGEVDLELRSQGFVPHCFAAAKRWPIAPWVHEAHPERPRLQMLEADAVYVRDFFHPETMDDEQLKQLALIADHCYGSIDLALRCVMLLERRKALPPGAEQEFRDLLALRASRKAERAER